MKVALQIEIRSVVEALSTLQRRHAILREARTKLNAGWKPDVVLAEIRAQGEAFGDAAPAAKGAA